MDAMTFPWMPILVTFAAFFFLVVFFKSFVVVGGVKIAEQNRQKAIRFAEGEGESVRLRAEGEAKGIRAKGEAEGARILAIGESTAKAYELQNKAVGAQGVTAIEIAKQVAAGNVKVTPDFLVQGGDNLGGLFSAYLTTLMTAKASAAEAKDKAVPAKG